MASSTATRLKNLVSLSVEEREALSDDLAVEFETASRTEDRNAMARALAGLERVDVFEELAEQMEENEKTADAAETDADTDTEEAPADADADASTEGNAADGESIDKAVKRNSDAADKVAETPADDAEADKPADVDAEVDETPADAAPADAPETAADADADATEIEAPSESESEVTAMAAAAVTESKDLKPITASAGDGKTQLSVIARAGAEIEGYSPGEPFRDRNDISQAFVDRIHATAGMSDGIKSIVASMRTTVPSERMLDPNNANLNQEKIDAITSETALVASGGFCAPLPINYDIFGVGSTARPVRDSLPTFGATRGGIRYIQPPVLGSYTGALSLWTALNDVNPTNPVTKPVLKVNCANELTASTDAITLSLEFGNLMTRAFPELVQRHNQLALIEHARFAEKTLLAKISALSSKVTVNADLGTARDLLSAIARASAQYRNRHRIPRGVRLRLLMPDWTLDAIREDIASNLAIENIAVDDGTVQAWFAARGFSISWYMDDNFAAQTPGGVLNDWPSTIKFWLFAEGTLLFLDGGTLDLGVIRDAELVSTNDYVTFVETFEGVAKVGLEVLEVSAATSTGIVTAPVTP